MLNKEQYDILNLIKDHDSTNPITAVDVLNYPFYNGLHNPVKTDVNLKTLSEYHYISLDDPTLPTYRIGYHGYVYITSHGYMALNDYEHQVQLSESIAELRAIADSSKELAKTAESEAKAAESNAKCSKIISIIALCISAVSVISAIVLHFI